jgi:putative acetyltransferase
LPRATRTGKLPGRTMPELTQFLIAPARGDADYEDARRLIREYAASLPFGLDFQGFQGELANLGAVYGPPSGELLLARRGGAVAGVVGVRPLVDDVCEMKRMYVIPAMRGRGLGLALGFAIMRAARELGYRRMRLDTIDSMQAAIKNYRALGCVEIPPYYDNPIPGARYFELML